MSNSEFFTYFYEEWYRAPFFKFIDYEIVVFIQIQVSQEECARLRESVPYVKVYRYNPKHLYPELNGYRDNGLRKLGASCGSKYCNLHR